MFLNSEGQWSDMYMYGKCTQIECYTPFCEMGVRLFTCQIANILVSMVIFSVIMYACCITKTNIHLSLSLSLSPSLSFPLSHLLNLTLPLQQMSSLLTNLVSLPVVYMSLWLLYLLLVLPPSLCTL